MGAHFVNSTVQLDFMEEPAGSQDIPEWETRSCHKEVLPGTNKITEVCLNSPPGLRNGTSLLWLQEFGFVSKESRSRKTRNKQPSCWGWCRGQGWIGNYFGMKQGPVQGAKRRWERLKWVQTMTSLHFTGLSPRLSVHPSWVQRRKCYREIS